MRTCANCGDSKSQVTDSRETGDTTRRRRECRTCGHGWTTIEICPEELERKMSYLSDFAREHAEAFGKALKGVNAYRLFPKDSP